MDILLVLGSVTAKQYEPVRLAMLQRGLKPQVVRIDTKLSTETDFLDHLFDEVKDVAGFQKMSDGLDKRTEETKQRIISEAFGDATMYDIKAIVREPLGEHESYLEKMAWLNEDLPVGIPEYTVMVGDDKGFWLQGEGYGSLQIR